MNLYIITYQSYSLDEKEGYQMYVVAESFCEAEKIFEKLKEDEKSDDDIIKIECITTVVYVQKKGA